MGLQERSSLFQAITLPHYVVFSRHSFYTAHHIRSIIVQINQSLISLQQRQQFFLFYKTEIKFLEHHESQYTVFLHSTTRALPRISGLHAHHLLEALVQLIGCIKDWIHLCSATSKITLQCAVWLTNVNFEYLRDGKRLAASR